MRLRQAHAMLQAAAAIEALGLGFETWPFDLDRPWSLVSTDEDLILGFTEIKDPATPFVRKYNIELRPGPGDAEITMVVDFGIGPERPLIVRRDFSVAQTEDEFDTGIGESVASAVATAVRDHEKPYRDAYLARLPEARARRARRISS